MSWISKLKEYAPHIAGAVLSGGATLPSLAMKAIADVTGSEVNTLSEAETIINGASPELMLEIKKADYSFKLEMERLKNDLAYANLEDGQKSHQQQQETIRNGDNATDEYVRRTRPKLVRESWNATVTYCLGYFVYSLFVPDGVEFNATLAGFLISPTLAYMGFRTGDKFANAIGIKNNIKWPTSS